MEPQHLLPPYPSVEEKQPLWSVRALLYLVLYGCAAWFLIHNIYIILFFTLVLLLHECGHYLAMRYYGYEDVGIFFIPFIGGYVKGYKQEISQWQSTIILLAGPLPGIVIGAIFYTLSPHWVIGGISMQQIAVLFLLPNIVNLLPIYPLDGGQLLYRCLLDENERAFKIINILVIATIVFAAYYFKAMILLIPAGYLALKMNQPPSILDIIEKKATDLSIDLNKSYETLTPQEYWQLRNLVILYHSDFKHVPVAPPYEYAQEEDKLMHTIKLVLNRYLILDMPLWGKCLVALIMLAIYGLAWSMELDWFFWIKPFSI